MAIVKMGPMVGFSGTVDGITYYQLPDGRTAAKKKNGPRKVPATMLQQAVNTDTRIFAEFMRPLTNFVKIGYELESRIHYIHPYNAMVKAMRKVALEGEYPNRSINFSNVLVTKGDMPVPAQTAVKVTEEGLVYSWSTELLPQLTHHSDQVMMLAYFPELKQTAYVASGAQRYKGEDLLELKGIEKGYHAEVYISFAADDRKSIANSVYLGNFFWS